MEVLLAALVIQSYHRRSYLKNSYGFERWKSLEEIEPKTEGIDVLTISRVLLSPGPSWKDGAWSKRFNRISSYRECWQQHAGQVALANGVDTKASPHAQPLRIVLFITLFRC